MNGARTFSVYGLALLSDMSLDLPTRGPAPFGAVRLRAGGAAEFEDACEEARFDPASDFWCQYARLRDDSTYVRWDTVGEFIVSACGGEVRYRQFDEAHTESFQVYMLGQALSFALLNRGLEPLHATAVALDGRAVVLLGESGAGKSTLAAALLDAGGLLVTDDVLMVGEGEDGLCALPGPARMKLFPEVAATRATGSHGAMNRFTEKLIVPVHERLICRTPVPIGAFYEIQAPDGDEGAALRIESMSPRDAVMALVRAAFNRYVDGPDRLARQLAASAAVAERVPVRRLTYPRKLSLVRDVVAALRGEVHLESDRGRSGSFERMDRRRDMAASDASVSNFHPGNTPPDPRQPSEC